LFWPKQIKFRKSVKSVLAAEMVLSCFAPFIAPHAFYVGDKGMMILLYLLPAAPHKGIKHLIISE